PGHVVEDERGPYAETAKESLHPLFHCPDAVYLPVSGRPHPQLQDAPRIVLGALDVAPVPGHVEAHAAVTTRKFVHQPEVDLVAPREDDVLRSARLEDRGVVIELALRQRERIDLGDRRHCEAVIEERAGGARDAEPAGAVDGDDPGAGRARARDERLLIRAEGTALVQAGRRVRGGGPGNRHRRSRGVDAELTALGGVEIEDLRPSAEADPHLSTPRMSQEAQLGVLSDRDAQSTAFADEAAAVGEVRPLLLPPRAGPLDEIPRNRARTHLADRSQQPYLRALGGGMTLAQRLDSDHVRVAVSQPTQRIPGPRVPQAVRPTVRGIVLDHVELERHLLDPVEHAVEVAD